MIPNQIQKNETIAQEIPAPNWSSLSMGPVTLFVKELTTQLLFYRDHIGLEALTTHPDSVVLGYLSTPILHLIQNPTLQVFPSHAAGLYHLAILFTSRSTLATVVEKVISSYAQNFQGTADHLVSEAFYFSDPEGNGVELYFDKDPATWQWQNGRIMMDSLPLDPVRYIQTYKSETSDTQKKIGHVHLQVGNIAQARHFYVDTLGLSITAEFESALFVSDGTYHHHLGMNIWQSNGAGTRTETLGLANFNLQLSESTAYLQLIERLTKLNIMYQQSANQLAIHDPWHNLLYINLIPSTKI